MSLTAVATGSMSKLMEVQYFGIEKQFMFNRLMWNRAPPGYSCGFSRFWLLWCIRSSLGWLDIKSVATAYPQHHCDT